jgi:tetratricopeptide (TPR) repeat protein
VKLDLDLWRVKPEQLAWEQELAGADEALDALESNAAEEVALRSGVRLTPEDHARLATRPAVKREAYELYLKAKTLDYWDNENSERATAYLTRAIEIDPTFAVAYTALIPIYYNLGSPDDLKRADEMGQRALELDPTNAEVLYYEAAFAYYGGRQAESIAMFLELDAANPTNSDLQGKLANALSTLGLCEQALESGREALRIDPINLQNHFNYTWACLSCREWEQGVAGFEKFLDLYPDNALPHGNYALLLQGMGRYEEALEHCRISRELAGIDPTADWSIGSLLACLGREAEARAIAEKAARRWEEDKRSWRTTTASDAVGLISLFVCLGEYDQALHWLSETVEAGAGYGLNWPLFFYDPIREFPEATELARKAGAPEWSLKRIEPAWSPKTAGASR